MKEVVSKQAHLIGGRATSGVPSNLRINRPISRLSHDDFPLMCYAPVEVYRDCTISDLVETIGRITRPSSGAARFSKGGNRVRF